MGLDRTNISEFGKKEFPTIGVSIELPSKQERLMLSDSEEYLRDWKCKLISFSMHPVYPGGFNEPLYLINFRLAYLKKGAYDSYLQNKHVENGNRCLKDIKFHDDIAEYEVIHPNGRTPLRCFRKDFKNEKTGDVVLAVITYMDNFEGNVQFRDKDIEAIKRILNSIKFIDDKAVSDDSKK